MSLQHAAQHLAAQGRGPDKQLVHMSPREVAGLQALAIAHGGSLSINPETGLPEAGFLDRLLPTILGAGLMFATGGAAGAPLIAGLSNATTIGLGVGALQAARTGDLRKGIMAGLGAYGGAGLTAGLAGPGMTVANPQAAQIAAAPAAQAGVTGAPFEFGLSDPSLGLAEQAEMARAAFPPVAPPTQYADPYAMFKVDPATGSANPLNEIYRYNATDGAIGAQGPTRMVNFPDQGINTIPLEREPLAIFQSSDQLVQGTRPLVQFQPAANPFSTTVTAPPATVPAPVTPVSAAENLQAMSKSPIVSAPLPYDFGAATAAEQTAIQDAIAAQRPSTFAERFKAMPGKDLAKYGLAAAAPVLLAEPKSEPVKVDNEQFRYAYSPGRVDDPTAGFPAGYRGEYRYFQPSFTRMAMGGPVEDMSAANVYDMQNARGGVSDMGVDMSTGMQKMARGGVSHLGDYSDGGRLLRGPGDGVSDSIPAVIGRKRPARLADGEFVIPARIVSELGNGSTEAGARKLYAMMDRVQRARGKTTGKGKVAKNTRSDKYLPA